MLELSEIQSGVLRPRPTPYAATYILLRVDDAGAGRAALGRLADVVASAAHTTSPAGEAWMSVSLTYQGLKALGVPQSSLDSFAWEFRQGMAARAQVLGDVGESSPEHWEYPLGTSDVHVVLTCLAPDSQQLEAVLARARKAYQEAQGVTAVWRQDCHALPTEKEPFGYHDGISQPAIEGSGVPGSNPYEQPLKAGEFVLGYPDETGGLPSMPQPEVLGRNGTYVAFRKLHQRVAAFRRYLKEQAKSPEDEERLAAKMMGRWRSGTPLALRPDQDDPSLGDDCACRNAFTYADDPTGYKTPPGAHIRRANPRDASVAGVVRLHRMIRRGTVYGPELPEGELEDDGLDRGLMFAFIGAHLDRQFEFVQSEWLNGGEFLGLSDGLKDPIAGDNHDGGTHTIPTRPIARRLKGIPRFVVTRGGEYGFMPSLSALRWIAALET
ncbi:Dyp-type peroxidase [bacterium]|nr:Dyp-type peroxidase [bacterium]